MGKKKKNPNRIPVNWTDADTRRASDESTQEMVLLAWALVLCALGDRMDTTTDSLMDFWVSVNERSTKLRTFDDIDRRLRKLKSVVGIDFPFRRIETSSIRTRADAERLNRKLRKNALHAMFALIADTVMEEEILDHEDLRWMFSKIQSREEDIDRGELGVADLVGVLEDEFSLRLADQDQNLTLELIDEAANVMPEADTYSG